MEVSAVYGKVGRVAVGHTEQGAFRVGGRQKARMEQLCLVVWARARISAQDRPAVAVRARSDSYAYPVFCY